MRDLTADRSPIAVVGGTGTVGRRIVAALTAAGAEVRALSRHSDHPVDLTTGAGLSEALRGCSTVVDAGNGSPVRPQAVLVDGTRRLLAVAAEAGIGHLVTVSIVGIDAVPAGYYRAKLDQETLVRTGPVPWTIVRSTQFHELINTALTASARWRITPRSPIKLQPVAADEAAQAIATIALGTPQRATITVAGPEIQDLSALAATWATQRRRRLLRVPLRMPGRLQRPLAAGALTAPTPNHRGQTTFAQWLMRTK